MSMKAKRSKENLDRLIPGTLIRLRDEHEKGSKDYNYYDKKVNEELKSSMFKIYKTTKEIAETTHIHVFKHEGDTLIMSPLENRKEAARLDYEEKDRN